MIINRVKITNFRNIEFAEFSLQSVNPAIFAGRNKLGKTNTILAIYWAMTDFMMDGSSDFPSIKPYQSPRAEVCVEIEFDRFTLKKTYKEKWTKTRGSEEEKMTGHETRYYIDGMKSSITNAKKEISEKFGTNVFQGRFDLLRGIVNPYYFATVEWKTLREFIISIVGDVSNEEIIHAMPGANEMALKRLEQDGFNTEKTSKYFNQRVATLKKDATRKEYEISGLKTISKPSDGDFEHAQERHEEIICQMYQLKSGGDTNSALNKEVDLALQELNRCQEEDLARAKDERIKLDEEISLKQQHLDQFVQDVETIRNELSQFEQSLSVQQIESRRCEMEASTAEKYAEDALVTYKKMCKQYDDLMNWTPPSLEHCPHCGGALNSEFVKSAKEQHTSSISECVKQGKNAKVEMETANAYIENEKLKAQTSREREAELQVLINEKKKAISEKMESVNSLRNEILMLSNGMNNSPSKETIKARHKYDDAIANLGIAKRRSAQEHANAVHSLEEEKKKLECVLSAKSAWESAQSQINNLQNELQAIQKEIVRTEVCAMYVKEFIAKKLELLNTHIEKVFGSMGFKLIEPNIKEGSWNEVCVPMIIGSETPFLNGSGAEKLISGIHFSECVRRHFGIDPIPVIFDEAEKLDSDHLKGIGTDSQIITTKVDDDYNEVVLLK